MTYGRGNFWKRVDKSAYRLTTNDLFKPADVQADLRSMPFAHSSFDATVLDPPYMDRDGGYQRADYGVGCSDEIRTLSGIRRLYFAGAREAHRLLRTKGILILKCQDSVTTWNHRDFMTLPGFECIDVFVLMQSGRPPWYPKWQHQHHARKNHSFFIVLRKA
jgi:tRNA G10  N-methylase Trm11